MFLLFVRSTAKMLAQDSVITVLGAISLLQVRTSFRLALRRRLVLVLMISP